MDVIADTCAQTAPTTEAKLGRVNLAHKAAKNLGSNENPVIHGEFSGTLAKGVAFCVGPLLSLA